MDDAKKQDESANASKWHPKRSLLLPLAAILLLTILQLLEITLPESMTGRPIDEALKGKPDVDEGDIGKNTTSVRYQDYEATLDSVAYKGHLYFNYATVER